MFTRGKASFINVYVKKFIIKDKRFMSYLVGGAGGGIEKRLMMGSLELLLMKKRIEKKK